ncbi:hypothetical protein DL96DRAFT_571462 [Flagelloscypha sp. PMI_526]|nr:hypothetical protein DL96DRAFT_571462 [Flagelloscypha sp. PMI_526]
MNTPSLPPEVIYTVLQNISIDTISRDRRQTLRHCCLVCHDFRSIAQPLLFSSLELNENLLDVDQGNSFVQIMRSSPSLADLVQELHVPISTADWRRGTFVADLLPLVKHVRNLGVYSLDLGRPGWGDFSGVVLRSFRHFWQGSQGEVLTHLTLESIYEFRFSGLVVPNLQELNLISFCSARNDPEVVQRPKHRLMRLTLDHFESYDLFGETSLQLFVQNSIQPLESLVFKAYTEYYAEFNVFHAITQFLGPWMSSLIHLRIDNPERHYRDGALDTFNLPALASLQVFEVRIQSDDEEHLPFLNKWMASQLKSLLSTQPFSLLELYLYEGYTSEFQEWFDRCTYVFPGLDQGLCDSRRKVRVSLLKSRREEYESEDTPRGSVIISENLQTQAKCFVEGALPVAFHSGLVKVDVAFNEDY